MACLGEWAIQYLDFSKQQFTKEHYRDKVTAFKMFIKYFDPSMSVCCLTEKKVLEYKITQLRARSGHAANKDCINLKAGWNWGKKYMLPALPERNPFEGVEDMPEVRRPRYVPPLEDVWKVCELCDTQDKALIFTYLFTSARKKEIFRLTWADINFEMGTIRLSTRKRSKGTLEYDNIAMSKPLADILLSHLENLRNCRSVIPYNVFSDKNGQAYVDRNKFFPRLCARAGVKPFGYHGLRHLGSTALYHDGVSIAEIQSILRHKSPLTTQTYLHSLGAASTKPAMERLAELMQFPSPSKKKDTSRDTHHKSVLMSKISAL